MARIVFISPYLRGGRDEKILANRTRYIATREGTELLRDEYADEPATRKQREFVQRIVRSYPEMADLPEYENYMQKPSRGNAHEFISEASEFCMSDMSTSENYIDYIANRPGTQLYGEHGLWDANGKVPVFANAIDEVAHHPGIVWTPVVSIRRDDAERLGYNDTENWRELVRGSACQIAEAYKIHPDNLRWYAAFHRKEKQVHIHLIIFSSDPKEGYLTKKGIQDMKSVFARKIFRQDLVSVYTQQTEYRNRLQRDAHARMQELISQMEQNTVCSDTLATLTTELTERLKSTGGRKVYGYLPPRTKRIVDAIVDEIAKDERVSEAYELWQEMRDEICRTYNKTLPERLPLSAQTEFKPVRNMVIREALHLLELQQSFQDADMEDEPEERIEPQDDTDKKRMRIIYEQADRYRSAKRILLSEESATEDKERAIAKLEQLWNEGYTISAHLLGRYYRDNADVETAVMWYRRSADSGNDCSEYPLGKLLLESGETEEGLRYIERSAERGYAVASYRLGKVFLTGDAIPRDTAKAVQHLTTAAESGNQYAQYSLAKLYLKGDGVPKDTAIALHWFSLAAEQGNTYAQYFVDRIHSGAFNRTNVEVPRVMVASSVIGMLRSVGGIFRNNTDALDSTTTAQHIDRKRRKELQQKRIAMGHKADDHEDDVRL